MNKNIRDYINLIENAQIGESEGVAEGLGKNIKRAAQGWGGAQDKPADIVKRNKAHDIDTAKKLRAGMDDAPEHTPQGLQKRVLDRKLKGVAEGSLEEFAPGGFNGGDDDEGFSPEIAKMAQEDGFTKGASFADGATLERAITINHWHSQHGGMYKQYFAKGFKAGRLEKIRHDNKQYNLNLKLMKDGSIHHGEQK